MKIFITNDSIEIIDTTFAEATAAISVLTDAIRRMINSKGDPITETVLRVICKHAVDLGFKIEEIEP